MPKLPSAQEFYVNNGLYHEISLEGEVREELFSLIYRHCIIDCHCVYCDKESTFLADNIQSNRAELDSLRGSDPKWKKWNLDNMSLCETREFSCTRTPFHKIFFNILINKGKLQKIGQYPSLKDLNILEIKEFKAVLGTDFKEYATAMGLFSHGVGVGSFVYLRRIIENFIILPAYDQAKGAEDWDEAKFRQGRMKEKIDVLRDHLPEYLIKNNKIYSVLSKGIHELSDEECLKLFPVISSILNLVLLEVKDRREIEDRKESLSKELLRIEASINSQ